MPFAMPPFWYQLVCNKKNIQKAGPSLDEEMFSAFARWSQYGYDVIKSSVVNILYLVANKTTCLGKIRKTKMKVKIMLLGDTDVGKSTLLHRYINKAVCNNIEATVGVLDNFGVEWDVEGVDFSVVDHVPGHNVV